MLKYIDTHSHLFDKAFEKDVDSVIESAIAAGVDKIIMPAVDSVSHDDMLALAARYPGVLYATAGVHPTSLNDNPDSEPEFDEVEHLLSQQDVPIVAIGEVGLDLYWSRDSITTQIDILNRQIELSKKHNLPLIIHTREAFPQIIDVLSQHKGLRGVFHGFSGTIDDYYILSELGDFYFGIGGVVTFKKSPLPDVLTTMPLERILLETDSPYLTPVPYRGTRNNSSYIPIIATKIADIKRVQLDTVAQITTENAKKLFYI